MFIINFFINSKQISAYSSTYGHIYVGWIIDTSYIFPIICITQHNINILNKLMICISLFCFGVIEEEEEEEEEE